MTAASRAPRRIVLRPVPRRAGSPDPSPRRYRLARLAAEGPALGLAPAPAPAPPAADRFAHLKRTHD